MAICYSCRKSFTGKPYRSTIGEPACRSCSNIQMGAVIGAGSGASTGETLGLIHVLNTWRTGTKRSKARDEAATTPLIRMPWKRSPRKAEGDA